MNYQRVADNSYLIYAGTSGHFNLTAWRIFSALEEASERNVEEKNTEE
jgi:hypothetical protein